MATLVQMGCWLNTLQRLGWSDERALAEPQQPQLSHLSDCWFRASLELERSNYGAYPRPWLNRRGRAALERCIEAGWVLRSTWPRTWHTSVTQWLGERLILGHASLFCDSTPLISLVSSQLGRHGCHYPPWPAWIDGTLRRVQRERGRVLLAPGSTLTDSVEHFANRAALPQAKVEWEQGGDISSWLVRHLHSLLAGQLTPRQTHQTLFLSPEISPAAVTFQPFPLQDRVSLALADRVWALSLRPGGKLQRLVERRLQDPLYLLGSMFVTLTNQPSLSGKPSTARSQAQRESTGQGWLAQGAVGWVVNNPPAAPSSPVRHCRNETSQSAGVQQWTGPLPAVWRKLKASDTSQYLVHCTRGSVGPLMDESPSSYRERVWLEGVQTVWQPLETLAHISRTGRLRAAAAMTRTESRCVSWSAVPLLPLLQRRTYRSHLARWDWEPYGLLVRRDVLQGLGAREVIYGDEQEFEQLAVCDQPFFQPRSRRDKASVSSWTDEREWRLLGDLRLHELPPHSILAFVRTQAEAAQCARYFPWPILWVQ
jgi:hypothetical protein